MKTPFSDQSVEFSQLVLGFSSAVLHYLGEGPGAENKPGAKDTNLALAKQNIEILRMLKAKTSGNLTAEESRLVDSVLTDLMMKFHQASGK